MDSCDDSEEISPLGNSFGDAMLLFLVTSVGVSGEYATGGGVGGLEGCLCKVGVTSCEWGYGLDGVCLEDEGE